MIMFGQVCVTCTFLVLLSCCRLGLLDYSNIILLASRALVTFYTFVAIRNGNPGFEESDPKLSIDVIQFVMFPGLLLCSVNMKIELLVTFPLTLVCILYT